MEQGENQGLENGEKRVAFMLREIQNQIKQIIHKSLPRFEKGPRSQLQGGVLGYLFHHRDGPVYQRDLEKEFRVSRATATNTLQVMEREGLIVRRAQDRDARLKRIQMTEEAYQNHRQVEAHMDMMDRRMLGGADEGGGAGAAQASWSCAEESGGTEHGTGGAGLGRGRRYAA